MNIINFAWTTYILVLLDKDASKELEEFLDFS